MRVEMPSVSQPLVDSSKAVDKKELTKPSADNSNDLDDSSSSFLSPLGFRSTYSVSSLRAAVDYNAKFLTVAESNVQAAQHPPKIPQAILDHFNAQ